MSANTIDMAITDVEKGFIISEGITKKHYAFSSASEMKLWLIEYVDKQFEPREEEKANESNTVGRCI